MKKARRILQNDPTIAIGGGDTAEIWPDARARARCARWAVRARAGRLSSTSSSTFAPIASMRGRRGSKVMQVLSKGPMVRYRFTNMVN